MIEFQPTNGKLLIWNKFSLIFFFLAIVTFICPPASDATPFQVDYTIKASDTITVVDKTKTTANINTELNEIALSPTGMAAATFFKDGGTDYAVLTSNGVKHYSFDGSSMIENTVLDTSAVTDPIALASGDYPDVIVGTSTGFQHYSFDGSSMVSNPVLSLSGLTQIAAVGSSDKEVAVLDGSKVSHYSFDGTSMTENTVLEPTTTFSNPISLAIADNGYDTAVLDGEQVRWFNFDGSGMSENPALTISNLDNPKFFAVGGKDNNYDVTAVEGNAVKQYSFDGSTFSYNASLSVTSGLNAPTAVAIRPGSYDRIIVDGKEVRYYQWDGSKLVYNASLSKTVSDIVIGNRYVQTSVLQSKYFNPGKIVSAVKVTANHELPTNTIVTWAVTADGGSHWVTRWRVKGIGGSSILEVSDDNGSTWTNDGTAIDATTTATNSKLWAKVTPGNAVGFKATLERPADSPSITPKIATNPRGNVAVRINTDSAPLPPVLPPGGGTGVDGKCFVTSMPPLQWAFSDSDSGDAQTAYEVQISKVADIAGNIYDSDKKTGSDSSFSVPSSDDPTTPSVLWSAGQYEYYYRVKVWDGCDVDSDWSNWQTFCVVAFDRPRVSNIIDPPDWWDDKTAPFSGNLASHYIITPLMAKEVLPRIRAGAKITLMVDSIGPIKSTITTAFPYLSSTSTVSLVKGLNPSESKVNRWTIQFYTDADAKKCPANTLVQMNLHGDTTAKGSTGLNAPSYADGLAVTAGSMYHKWSVVLQGRK